MRKLVSALLYTSLALVANGALAESTPPVELTGEMSALNWHSEPRELSDVTFQSRDGAETTFADHEGKVLVVNFWATWCAPCREEMPSLAALQDEMASDDFEVITIATGRNPPAAVDRFFEEIGVDSLPIYMDNSMKVARSMAVLGLPVTIVVDKDGNEVARLTGGADWNSAEAKALIQAMID